MIAFYSTTDQPTQGWLFLFSSSLTSLFRCALQRRALRRHPMLSAPTDLRRSQQLLHDAKQIMTDAATSLAHSRMLIARGKARAVARARAAVMYDETFPE